MGIAHCKRCKLPLSVQPKPQSEATMLRRAKGPDGYCLDCAVHDWLRNTYPVNLQLAESGPRILLFPHVRELFARIMRIAKAEALPEEINWNRIGENWDLPFPEPTKFSGRNPVSQAELEEVATGKRPGLGESARKWAERARDPLGGKSEPRRGGALSDANLSFLSVRGGDR